MSLKISVVVPSLNQAGFLGDTLDSILGQRGPFELECIIVDGASTDGSQAIIESRLSAAEIAGVDFRWSSEPDGGQTDAINKGLARTTGDILAYLNSDDCYRPNTLAAVASAFSPRDDIQWVTGDCILVDETGREIQRYVRAYRRWWLRHYSRTRLTMLNFVAQPATFWRRGAMDRIGRFDETLHYTMDYDYWLRLSALSSPLYVDSALAEFRIHAGSKGGSRFRPQFAEDYRTAARYGDSAAARMFHRLHNAAVVAVYGVLK